MSPDSHMKKCSDWGWTFENQMFLHSIFGCHPKTKTEFKWRLLNRLSSPFLNRTSNIPCFDCIRISNTPFPVLFNFFELRMTLIIQILFSVRLNEITTHYNSVRNAQVNAPKASPFCFLQKLFVQGKRNYLLYTSTLNVDQDVSQSKLQCRIP